MNTDRIKELAMSDNGFIFDPTTGYSYHTNELGFYILRMLQRDHKKEEITKQIIKEYDISEDHLIHDYDHFIMMLESLKLVED